ncbi:MAG: hypothetical protein ACRDKH_00810 [Solirubrobacterales bacterium]
METTVETGRIGALLADAAEFFESYLWESDGAGAARDALAKQSLDEKTSRAFGLGYAPIGRDELIDHHSGLGYSSEELVGAGLATRSGRGGTHAHFRSRVMFPIRDRSGRVLGFAGLGTHLGPSWPLWVISPDAGLYRRSEAVFAIDRAARPIAESGTALVRTDCIGVLRAHQGGERNAIAVHTNALTRSQINALSTGVRGGAGALELELPPGMEVESRRKPAAVKATPSATRIASRERSEAEAARPRHLRLKRMPLVTATALAAINACTGAPLLAVWVGSQVQSDRLLSLPAVAIVVATLAVLAFLLGWALTWLNAKYDALTGRPAVAGQTSPWQRMKRGDRVEDIRSRYGVSAPEKAVAASVAAGVLAFEVWFFFFAGSPI